MYANQVNKLSTRQHLSAYELGFRISPDITIEYINAKTNIPDPEMNVVDQKKADEDEEEDYDCYFNPLTYCSITMEEEEEEGNESVRQNGTEIAKNAPSKENSSSVCNGADLSQPPLSAPKIKKRFSCHVCEKTFGWTTDLKRHLLIHTGERPFKCTMCLATFTRNFLLQKHKSKIHQCLSPNKISQLNNSVAKNIMEIKLKMRQLEKEKNKDVETSPTPSHKRSKKNV